MIIQPEWGTRNVNKCFYESEARRIADLNEIFGEVELTEDEQRILIWLAGWDEYTIENVLSVIQLWRQKQNSWKPPVRRTEKPQQDAMAALMVAE